MITKKINFNTDQKELEIEINKALEAGLEVYYNVNSFEAFCIPPKMDYMCDYDTTWGAETKNIEDQKASLLKFYKKESNDQKTLDYIREVLSSYKSETRKRQLIIDKTVQYVKDTLHNAEGGHDWWHIERVWKLSKRLSKSEESNSFIVELGALLHDIADSKFHGGDESIGPKKARAFLSSLYVDEEVITHVEKIITNISFKGGNHNQEFKSIELDIVQDADRIDALGAIGIARTFNYGGHKNRKLYDPDIPPKLNMTKEEYKNSTAPTINHFYEKLLLIKDRMNTSAGRKLAEQRHQFMVKYLEAFYKEWNVDE